MSIFADQKLACPSCETPVDCELVHSIAADRRPDLRDAILDGSFQLVECPSCGTRFRPEPEFVYLDIGRGQYIGVWPASARKRWREHAAQTRTVFDQSLGKDATPEAREIGEKLAVRVVFGWPALVEKLLAQQAGIDDRTLEAAKLAVLRSQAEVTIPGALELRLIAAKDGDPVLAWLGGGASETMPALRVPRQLIADIDAAPEKWQVLRDRVAEGDVVDFQRELLAA